MRSETLLCEVAHILILKVVVVMVVVVAHILITHTLGGSKEQLYSWKCNASMTGQQQIFTEQN